MVTVTTSQPPKAHVKPERALDYIYDSSYTVSSAKDHFKALLRSSTVEPVIVSNFKNMFSRSKIHPSSKIQFRSTGNPFLLKRAAELPYAEPAQVTGRDRYKYFKRPVIPYVQSAVNQVLFVSQRPTVQTQEAAMRPPSPLTKTIGIQTIFRESEAQTDPYTPEFVVRPNSAPEILTLATLSFGNGLPAGLAEIEMIERARAKRAWEASLPPPVDQEKFKLRVREMEKMELQEWAHRELEIKALQDMRLDMVKSLIQKHEDENERLNKERIETKWQRKLQEDEILTEKIEKRRAKNQRKLIEQRKSMTRSKKRDIIEEYSTYSSRVYAPLAREGMFQKKSVYREYLDPRIDKYEDLVKIEKELQHLWEPMVKSPLDEKKHLTPSERAEHRIQIQLEAMEIKLKESKLSQHKEVKPLKYLQKIEKAIQRPPTPQISTPDLFEEDKKVAVIMLQRLLRGRCRQYEMYYGKEKRIELIQELRNRQQLRQGLIPQIVDELTLKSFEKQNLQQALFDKTISGEIVGQDLDFLSKELVRLREQQKIAAMVMLAERTRRMREAEESGRRQQEINRQIKEDELYRQVVSIHQETVDTYLEDVILQSMDQVADINARVHVREYADQLNKVVDRLQKSDSPTEATVSELLSNFLFPEVERESIRQNLKKDEKKYMLAAHNSVYSSLEKIEEALKPSSSKKE